jgi:drug/metabolite transporter (DMT)-like permease
VPVIPFVLLAALLHATWNALVKSMDDRLAVMGVLGATAVAVCVPAALIAPLPHGASLPFLVGSVAVHTIYNLLLIGCYRDSDFNQVYPVARGLAPPVVAICAVLLVGERLVTLQAVGLGVLTVGMLTIAAGRGRASGRGLMFAGLTGLAIAVWWVRRGRAGTSRRLPSGLVVRAAGAGVLSVIAYGLVLWAQTRGALAVVAALRETSVVFGALIGAAMFHERMPSRRVLASALIAGGAVILAAG